jgi:uncharacterized membrane protein YjjP (DUF1212 family)
MIETFVRWICIAFVVLAIAAMWGHAGFGKPDTVVPFTIVAIIYGLAFWGFMR